jgi:hypothetical protein
MDVMKYYRLQSDQIQMTGSVEKQSGPAIFKLVAGKSYEAKASSLPFRFSFESNGKPLCDYYSANCLMSKGLVDALKASGVDNLQVYPTVLTEGSSGAVREDYCVVNVIGLVAAADMEKSEAIPLGGGQVFTSLEVDPARGKGLLMFRLAESRIDLIVHEKVATAVEAGQFRGVVLSPVSSD